MLQPVERFGLDASILFSDILVIPDALGVEVTFRDGDGPHLRPIRTGADVDQLRPDEVQSNLSPVFRAVEMAADALPKEVALVGFAGAPWTVACYMVEGHGSKDFIGVKRWAYSDPDGFQRLIDILVQVTAEYLIEQVRHGVEAIQIFDTWAGLLHADAFDRWCIAPTKAVIERFRVMCPDVPVIGFPRGAGLLLKRFARRTGVDAVSIDSGVPPIWAAQELQPDWAVQGNLDPAALLVGGELLMDQVGAILDALVHGPFVFNVGHGLLPDTPPENVKKLVDTVRAWGIRDD
jgi:uroporphyrinogen decarboxylase